MAPAPHRVQESLLLLGQLEQLLLIGQVFLLATAQLYVSKQILSILQLVLELLQSGKESRC